MNSPAPRKIVLATRNPGKVTEIRSVLEPLGIELVGLEQVDPAAQIDEPAEDGATFADNARAKAAYYAHATGLWALADDSGLAVDALGGDPGVRSARYAADHVPPGSPRQIIDQANNRKLLSALAHVPPEHRTARFVCHLALSDGKEILLEADGVIEGRIGYEPRGDNGFGYDPLFELPAQGKTTAELASAEKNAISHRGQATRQFASRLGEVLRRRGPTTGEPP